MTKKIRQTSQEMYSLNPQAYVESKVHSKGESLVRLRELIDMQPGGKVLDVATGGGHTARAFSDVAIVTASDLTHAMLLSARDNLSDAEAIQFVQHDALAFPYPDSTFNLVTSRIAPHHFPAIRTFIYEAQRVLVAGGMLAVADNISSGEPKSAKAYNTFEKLRDPSHVWSYSLDDWDAFMTGSGFRVVQKEILFKEMEFDSWAARMKVEGNDLLRLKALLLRGPEELQEWVMPKQEGQRVTFTLTEGIILGIK